MPGTREAQMEVEKIKFDWHIWMDLVYIRLLTGKMHRVCNNEVCR